MDPNFSDPQFQQFPAPQSPMMGSGFASDPLAQAAQTQQYMMQNNAMVYQQQAMLNSQMGGMPMAWASTAQTIYDPSSGAVRGPMSQTLAIAQSNMMTGLQNVMQGTMMAGSQLSQQFSRMYGAGQRITNPNYNDVYLGPNNFALEGTFRRELMSRMGFAHETPVGRMMMGGYRPDFLTESEFTKQMRAGWDSRWVGGGITAGATAAEVLAFGGSGMSFGASLLAAPVIAGVKRGILSTEHFAEKQAVADAWKEDAIKRYGYGAGGFFDRETSAGVALTMEHHDKPTWTQRFLGKGISRKLGIAPEIQYEDVKKQMEELGMFSMRSGDFDREKVTAGIKNIADDMKWLAGLARTMKEEIPKIAAQLQQGGGLAYNDPRLQQLTRQVAHTASVTGIDASQLGGAYAQSMRAGRAMGFDGSNFGTDLTNAIQSTVSLQSMGIINPGINAVGLAQNIQMSSAQNMRMNPFFMMQGQPGSTASGQMQNFMNKMSKDPNEWIFHMYGKKAGANAHGQMFTGIDNFIKYARENNVANGLGRDALGMMAINMFNPDMSLEEQQAVFSQWYLGGDFADRAKNIDLLARGLETGEVERNLMMKHGMSEGEAKERSEVIRRKIKDNLRSDDVIKYVESGEASESLNPLLLEKRDKAYNLFGGREKVRYSEGGKTSPVGHDLKYWLKKPRKWDKFKGYVWGAVAGRLTGGGYNNNFSVQAIETARNMVDLNDPLLTEFRIANPNMDANTAKITLGTLLMAPEDQQEEMIRKLSLGSRKGEDLEKVVKALKNGQLEKAREYAGGEDDATKGERTLAIAKAYGIDLEGKINNIQLSDKELGAAGSEKTRARYNLNKTMEYLGGKENWANSKDRLYELTKVYRITNMKTGAGTYEDRSAGYINSNVVKAAFEEKEGANLAIRVEAAKSAYLQSYLGDRSYESLSESERATYDAGFAESLRKAGLGGKIDEGMYQEDAKINKPKALINALVKNYGEDRSFESRMKKKGFESLIEKVRGSVLTSARSADILKKITDGEQSLRTNPEEFRKMLENDLGTDFYRAISKLASTATGDEKRTADKLLADYNENKEEYNKALTRQLLGGVEKAATPEKRRSYIALMSGLSEQARAMGFEGVNAEQVGKAVRATSYMTKADDTNRKDVIAAAKEAGPALRALLRHQFASKKEDGTKDYSKGDELWGEIQRGTISSQGLNTIGESLKTLAAEGGMSKEDLANLSKSLDMSDQGRATEALNTFNSILQAIASKMDITIDTTPTNVGFGQAPTPPSSGPAVAGSTGGDFKTPTESPIVHGASGATVDEWGEMVTLR